MLSANRSFAGIGIEIFLRADELAGDASII
jgi:hypothetical protein